MNVSRPLKQQELYDWKPEETPGDRRSEMFVASYLSESPTGLFRLMEVIVERNNMRRALQRVRRNKGAPGVDGMTDRKSVV